MKKIKLTKGKYTVVDNTDFDLLSRYTWYTHDNHGLFYAIRHQRFADGARKRIPMHDFIMNPQDGFQVDHKNGDSLDNRRCNLRLCTQSENLRNRGMRVDNKSGYKGVHWNNNCKRWHAQIKLDKRVIYLGVFREKIEAAKAYNDAAVLYHGEFARLNVI